MQPPGSFSKEFPTILTSITQSVGLLGTLGVLLFIITSSSFEPATKQWACATVAAMVGYWLGRKSR